MMYPRLGQFRVAIICARVSEADACISMLDERFETSQYHMPPSLCAYTFGSIGYHKVVIVHLGDAGKSSAAQAVGSVASSFPNIELGLVVGFCGAVPQPKHSSEEILLGDIIISGRILDYDFRRYYDGLSEIRGYTDVASTAEVQSFLQKMQGYHERIKIMELIHQVGIKVRDESFGHFDFPGYEEDRMYIASYLHKHHDQQCHDGCDIDGQVCVAARKFSCEILQCKTSDRKRSRTEPRLHFGLIASGDAVMMSASKRDSIANEHNIIAFEMEGAGIPHSFPTIVIKGACDYADGHKNKKWQNYAALNAACCAKALLREWRVCESDPNSLLNRSVLTQVGLIAFLLCLAALAISIFGSKLSVKEATFISPKSGLDASKPIYALLGKTGVGKSSFINMVGGAHIDTGEPAHVEHSLVSGTQDINIYEFHSRETGKGYLIDTPGIDETPEMEDRRSHRSNLQIMNLVRNHIQSLVTSDKLLMGLLYFYDIQQPKIDRGTFEGLDMTISIMEDLLGSNGVARITLVTTRWKERPTAEERELQDRHEQELYDKWWKGPLSCRSRLSRYLRTQESALRIIADLHSVDRQRLLSSNNTRCNNFLGH